MTRYTYTKKRKYVRNERGTLSALMITAVVLAGVFIGSLAVDPYHMQVVYAQLQNATDAAAIAGAQDLWTSPNSAEPHALAIAAANYADGRAVSSSSSGTTVLVNVTQPGANSTGEVQVTASMRVSHLFAPVFGRNSDVITVSSTAGRSSTLQRVFAGQGTLPISVAWSVPSDDGFSLSQKHVGDTIDLTINSQQYSNAAWTSLTTGVVDANLINSYLNYIASLSSSGSTTTTGNGNGNSGSNGNGSGGGNGNGNGNGNSGSNSSSGGSSNSSANNSTVTPSVWVGEQISLLNGVLGNGSNGITSQSNLIGQTVTLPVVNSYPAFNQSQPVVGFVGFTIQSITYTNGNSNNGQVLKIRGTLAVSPELGTDMPSSGVQQPSGITNFTISPVQLIQ